MSKVSVIASAIAEIRRDMSDKEFAAALSSFTSGEYAPSPNTIQKYRTGQREPSYKDLQTILSFGTKHSQLSLQTLNELAEFFELPFIHTEDPPTNIFRGTLPGRTLEGKTYGIGSEYAPSSQEDVINIPILGQVPSGYPIDMMEHFEGNISLPASLLSKENYFFLRVKGELMKDVGISDKDLILVRFSQTAEDGQTIIARINGDQLTCKKFYKADDRVILLPANLDFQPIKKTDIEIIGIVEKILHNYQ